MAGRTEFSAQEVLSLSFDAANNRINVSASSVAPGAFPNGSAAAPSISFASDTGTGFYRVGASTIGVSFGGVLGITLAAGGMTFAAAQTWVFPANTTNALQFTDGTGFYMQFNTGTAVQGGLANLLVQRPNVTVSTSPGPVIEFESNTTTYSGTPNATQHGRMFYVGEGIFTKAAAGTVTLMSQAYHGGISLTGNLAVTTLATIFIANPSASAALITNYNGIQISGLAVGTTRNNQIMLQGGTTNAGVLLAGFVGISAVTNAAKATLNINAENTATTQILVCDTTVPILYNGVLLNFLAHT